MRKTLLTILLTSLSFLLHAQVINTEAKRIDQEEEGWAGTVDLGFSLIKNTREIIQFTNNTRVQYNRQKSRLLLLNELVVMKVDQSDLLNRGFQHVRYNYEFRRYLIPEAFVQVQYNQLWKIDLRLLAGAGPRFELFHSDSANIYLGTLVMYEYEEVNKGAEFNRDFRLSTYLSGGFTLKQNVEFNSITYFQPRLDAWEDFRISTENSLRFGITSRLGFKTTFGLSYDSRPPDDLQNIFYSWTNGISFNF